jgi:diadenosine tetraphosphate (Ap4A) HIT family hydrolase
VTNADHEMKMHQLPDEYLADAMPVAKKIALALEAALGVENYNILQVCSLS